MLARNVVAKLLPHKLCAFASLVLNNLFPFGLSTHFSNIVVILFKTRKNKKANARCKKIFLLNQFDSEVTHHPFLIKLRCNYFPLISFL